MEYLEKDPGKRPQRAGELIRRLEALSLELRTPGRAEECSRIVAAAGWQFDRASEF